MTPEEFKAFQAARAEQARQRTQQQNQQQNQQPTRPQAPQQPTQDPRSAFAMLADAVTRASQPKDPGSRVHLSDEAACNPAIAGWAEAYNGEYRRLIEQGNAPYLAADRAKTVAVGALPPLTSTPNIRNFIACVAYALGCDAIDIQKASRLLHAARLAHLHLRDEAAAEQKRSGSRPRGPYRKAPAKAAHAVVEAEIEIPANGTESAS